MKYVPNAMKFATQCRSNSLIINIFEIADLDQKLKTWADFVSKLQCAPIFKKFCTQCKSSMLNMNIVLGNDDPDPKLQIRVNLVPTQKTAPIFIKFRIQNKSNMLIRNIILASVQSAYMIIGSELLQAQNDCTGPQKPGRLVLK